MGVPAFSGLFAPHWREDARAVVVGMTLFTKREHIVRAALESVAFSTVDVLEAMRAKMPEATVLGAAMAAGLAAGFYSQVTEVRQFLQEAGGHEKFTPKMAEDTRKAE